MKNHVERISRTLDALSTKYENVLFLSNFNACVDDETMEDFCSSYGLKSLIKQLKCFKNSKNLSCIDLILASKPWSFHIKCVIETRLSDFYRMTVSVLKMHLRKLALKVIRYRDFRKFENEMFVDSLYLALISQNIDYTENPGLFFNIWQNKLKASCFKKKKVHPWE